MKVNKDVNRHLIDIELYYKNTIKLIYNFALFIFDDQSFSEEVAASTFMNAYRSSQNKMDLDELNAMCIKLIYKYGKEYFNVKRYLKSNESDTYTVDDIYQTNHKNLHIIKALRYLSYKERFILILFCYQKLSIRKIAHIIRMPKFIVRKHLVAASEKIVQHFIYL